MRILTILILLALSSHAGADFETASQAYRNKDYATAFEAFSEMAAEGDARSQTVLALMYKFGESTTVDLEKAFHWYLEAARQGYPPAQFNVGIMLADGAGVDADPESARMWLARALESGYERAADRLSVLNGDAELSGLSDEPIAWSKNWNLRLPNNIRFREPGTPLAHEPVYRIQLGAMSTTRGAQRLWKQILDRNSSLFQGLEPVYREGLSGSLTVWRVQAGSFNAYSTAKGLCARYNADPNKLSDCIVIQE